MAAYSPTKTFRTSAYPAINPSLPALSSAGKNIVITGGGSGIGSEIAKAFAQSGASSIALLGRTEDSLLRTKQEIEAEYGPTTKVSSYVADITNATALELSLKSHAASHGGHLHVLVANAGFLPTNATLLDSSPEDWYNGFEINVKGTFNLLRAFMPHATEDAVVLNTSSAVVHLPWVPGLSGYSASKLAAAKVYEYLHHEHPGLFVLNVHPGTINTAMLEKALGAKAGAEFPYDGANLPAHFMVWAASDEAKFLNGKTVWANWDVEELKAERDSIVGSGKFTLGLLHGDKTHGDGLDNGHGLRLSWFWSWKPFGSRLLNYSLSRVWIGKRLGSRLLN